MKGDNKNMKMLHEEMDADDSDDDYEVTYYFIFLIKGRSDPKIIFCLYFDPWVIRQR